MSRGDQQAVALETSECIDPANGWTLWEAFERTTDPALIKSWRAAQSDYEKVRTPIPSAPGSFLRRSPEAIRKYRVAALQSFLEAKSQFRQMLAGGGLYSIGLRDGRSVLPTPIFREGWKTLLIRNFEKSIAQERGRTKTKIYNVRIFPLIHSPEAIAQLSGRSFVEAFRRCVLNDPEVVAASKRIEEIERHKSVFLEGQFPGPMIEFRWPLEVTTDEFAYSFVRPLAYFVGDSLPKASAAIRHVSEIIVDRWQRLRRRLADGELVAQGTFARTGIVQNIDPLQWTRATLSVDVQNGDLLEYENYKPAVLWTGLRLRSATENQQLATASSLGDAQKSTKTSPLHVKPTNYNQPRSSTLEPRRAGRVANQIARAVELCGVKDLPGSRQWKEVATAIAPFMDKQPSTAHEWQALIKAVQRHFRR